MENEQYGWYLYQLSYHPQWSNEKDMFAYTLNCVKAWHHSGMPLDIVTDHEQAEALARNLLLLKDIHRNCVRSRNNDFLTGPITRGTRDQIEKTNAQLDWLYEFGLLTVTKQFPNTVSVTSAGVKVLKQMDDNTPVVIH